MLNCKLLILKGNYDTHTNCANCCLNDRVTIGYQYWQHINMELSVQYIIIPKTIHSSAFDHTT